MCVSPYIATRKDGSKVAVPCGHCLECRKAYQSEWTFRLKEEAKRTQFPAFITLTYADEYLPEEVDEWTGEVQPVVCKRDWQLFMKRLRKLGGDYLKDARYFAVGEYGARYNRPHMHAVLICPNIPNIPFLRKLVSDCWSYGFVKVEFARFKQFQYVCKYMNKLDNREHLVPPFRLFSRSLGLNFLTDRMVNYYLTTFNRTCINDKARIGLPRYYRKKLTEFAQALLPGFAEAGLEWSDCLEEFKPKLGTMAYFMKDFSEHYSELYEDATQHLCATIDGNVFETLVVRPQHPKDVWQYYMSKHKEIKDMLYESSRILLDCAIRNRIDKYTSFSDESVNTQILQE